MDSNLLKEAIADAKAERQTMYAWCKCGHGCMCSHCRVPMLKWYHRYKKGEDCFPKWMSELFEYYEKWGKDMSKQDVERLREELNVAFGESYVERFNEMLFAERIKRELPPEPLTDEQAQMMDELIAELEDEIGENV